MNIDVIIPTAKNPRDSHYSLYYTIEAILSQSVQASKIFVVENSDNVDSKSLLKERFGSKVEVIDGTGMPNNIAYARNLGVESGESEIVLFLDDDVVLAHRHYFSYIVELMQKFDFCCGAYRYWMPVDWYEYLSPKYTLNHNLLILKQKSFFPQSIDRATGSLKCSEYSYIGNFGAVRRDAFKKVGGFDVEYEGWLYQDTDLMMRLCYEGYTYEILSYTDIRCYHLSHPADKSLNSATNKKRFLDKMAQRRIYFRDHNFFGRFDSACLDVISFM